MGSLFLKSTFHVLRSNVGTNKKTMHGVQGYQISSITTYSKFGRSTSWFDRFKHGNDSTRGIRFFHTKCNVGLPYKNWAVRFLNSDFKLSTLEFVKKNKMLTLGVVLLIGFGSVERVPYSNRIHIVLSSDMLERYMGMYALKDKISKFEKSHKIVNQDNPEAIRVRKILDKLLGAMHSGLGLEHGYMICGNAPVLVGSGLIKEKAVGCRMKVRNRRAGKFCLKYGTKHLEQMNWEVILLNTNIDNASYIPPGHILIHGRSVKGRSDTEIATTLAHEIGHGVARHAGERLMRNLWYIPPMYILARITSLSWCLIFTQLFKQTGMFVKIERYFSRRRELEADHIGLMLMASAGYDPRVAPKVYEKNNNGSEESNSTHPPGRKRAKMLNSVEVMGRAVEIYEQVQAGKVVTSFI